MKGFMKFFSGLMWGGVIGATIALLFAPTSGEELRDQMQERRQMIQDEMKSAADTRRSALEHQLAELRTPHKSGE